MLEWSRSEMIKFVPAGKRDAILSITRIASIEAVAHGRLPGRFTCTAPPPPQLIQLQLIQTSPTRSTISRVIIVVTALETSPPNSTCRRPTRSHPPARLYQLVQGVPSPLRLPNREQIPLLLEAEVIVDRAQAEEARAGILRQFPGEYY